MNAKVVILAVSHVLLVMGETSASDSEIQDCSVTDQGILYTLEPTNFEVCGTGTATFHCRYEGSTANPYWVIDSIFYNSINSQLPPNHYYHDHTLYVINIMLDQNNTLYQCLLLSSSNGQLCAYRSTVGRLIVNCRHNRSSVIITSVDSVGIVDLHTTYVTSTISATAMQSDYNSRPFVSRTFKSVIGSHFINIGSSSISKLPMLHNNIVTVREVEKISRSSLNLSVAIAISIAAMLIGTFLLLTLFGLIYLKSKRKSNQVNIYDEPSLPEPIYQEVTNNPILCTKVDPEMMENRAYMTRLAANSVTVLEQCPAYISHQDIH